MNANITQDTIRACQNGTDDAALLQHRFDGSVRVVDSLAEAQPIGGAWRVLRHPAREWANGWVAQARDTAQNEGSSTHLAKLRATAADLAADELAEHHARELAATSTTPGYVLLTVEEVATWRRLVDELEPLLLP